MEKYITSLSINKQANELVIKRRNTGAAMAQSWWNTATQA